MKTTPQHTTGRKAKKLTKGRVRFPGICADAQKLGVHRVHLYEVLSGKRTSHRLIASYEMLKNGKELAQ